MAKCKKCGNGNFFTKLNEDGICFTCAAAEAKIKSSKHSAEFTPQSIVPPPTQVNVHTATPENMQPQDLLSNEERLLLWYLHKNGYPDKIPAYWQTKYNLYFEHSVRKLINEGYFVAGPQITPKGQKELKLAEYLWFSHSNKYMGCENLNGAMKLSKKYRSLDGATVLLRMLDDRAASDLKAGRWQFVISDYMNLAETHKKSKRYTEQLDCLCVGFYLTLNALKDENHVPSSSKKLHEFRSAMDVKHKENAKNRASEIIPAIKGLFINLELCGIDSRNFFLQSVAGFPSHGVDFPPDKAYAFLMR